MSHAGACCAFQNVYPTHRHLASTSPARPVPVWIRHPSDKSSAVTSFETDICIHIYYITYTLYNIYRSQMQQDTTYLCGILTRVASVACFPGAWRRGSWHFKSPVCTTIKHGLLFSASHYFSFLSKRSGRRMPPAERSAL